MTRRMAEEEPLIFPFTAGPSEDNDGFEDMEDRHKRAWTKTIDYDFHCTRRRRRYTMLFFAGLTFLLLVVCCVLSYMLMSTLGYFDFSFAGIKPAYLSSLPTEPVIIRLSIMSRPTEYTRRQLLRDYMLSGIPAEYLKLEYKFFVGTERMRDGKAARESIVLAESQTYGDLEILEDIEDIPEKISEKRFTALKWATHESSKTYDFAMTLDSDSFCRFKALAQRLHQLYPHLSPRTQPVLIGSMGYQSIYWNTTSNTSSRQSSSTLQEDKWFIGPQYQYPVGIGYMMSSNLAEEIIGAGTAIPHRIHYPYDDVMIGSWVSGLRLLRDEQQDFFQVKEQGVLEKVVPKPYLPRSVDTAVIDDKAGWHDYKNRGAISRQHSIGWDTVCVHRIKDDEVQKLRRKKEIRLEWDTPVAVL
ncbi:hypothetical protein D9613_008241 [Agrocybe pediades]|uniref:Hexosyltransferase n=1 Tax=Agrocybe pediades TaxID=84607 RepID=A0A8H4QS75_9AGAR|nr:hypothetical protein D9613_008241 [Agrocybe pediades]